MHTYTQCHSQYTLNSACLEPSFHLCFTLDQLYTPLTTYHTYQRVILRKLHIFSNGEILSKNDKIVGVSLHGALEIYDTSTFQPQGLGSTSPLYVEN